MKLTAEKKLKFRTYKYFIVLMAIVDSCVEQLKWHRALFSKAAVYYCFESLSLDKRNYCWKCFCSVRRHSKF